jgi:hypothetical protein
MVRPYLPASNDGHCVCVDVSVRIRNHPSDEWVYLQGREREAAGAVYVLAVSLFLHLDTFNRIAADGYYEAQSKQPPL